jgi:hypothetical protein
MIGQKKMAKIIVQIVHIYPVIIVDAIQIIQNQNMDRIAKDL